MYAKINRDQIVTYPYNLSQLKYDYPDTSFPPSLPEDELARWGVVSVMGTGQPEFDPINQTVEEVLPIFVPSSGRWEQQWSVRSATQGEIDERVDLIKKSIIGKTQFRLDSFARTRDYDSILSACTYVNSPTVKFASEAMYCVQQRDATWSKLYEIMGDIESGARPMPTKFEDIEGELPDLSWPTV